MKNSLLVIQVKTPCSESWEGMKGDEEARHCLKCCKTVTNLSALTEEEAASVVAQSSNSKVCVRFLQNSDGTPQFKPSRKQGGSLWQRFSLALATVLVLVGLVGRSEADETKSAPAPEATVKPGEEMGDLAIPDSQVLIGEVVAVEQPKQQKMGRVSAQPSSNKSQASTPVGQTLDESVKQK